MTMGDRSTAGDQVSEQGRFLARAFVARWARETGEAVSAVVADRMLFAYEMGYLRGRSDGARATSQMIEDFSPKGEAAKEEDDDESK